MCMLLTQQLLNGIISSAADGNRCLCMLQMCLLGSFKQTIKGGMNSTLGDSMCRTILLPACRQQVDSQVGLLDEGL